MMLIVASFRRSWLSMISFFWRQCVVPQTMSAPAMKAALTVWSLLYAVPFYAECCLAMVRARCGLRLASFRRDTTDSQGSSFVAAPVVHHRAGRKD